VWSGIRERENGLDRVGTIDTDRETPNKWLTLLTVAINGFLIILDISIVNISFPTLTRVFNTEPSIVLWVSVVYALVTVGLMLILGRIGDIYGRKKIFILGYVFFTVGLILCSLSQSMTQLILSRIVQGIGGAMNMALSMAIVTDAFPDRERGKALGIASAVFAVGPLLGFTIGGFLLDTFGWRSLFYTRVPICMIGILMAWKFLRENKVPNISTKLDYLGTATLFGSLSCLLLFLNMGGRSGFLSQTVLTLGITAVVLFALFLLQEKKTDQPVADLNLFKNRLFMGGTISLILFGLVQSSHFFLLPFYLISGAGFTSSTAGLFMAVPPVLFSSLAPVSGWLSDKLGSRPLCTVGFSFSCLGFFLCSRFNVDSSTSQIILGLAVFGMGGSLFFTPNASLLMGSAPKERLGTVGALVTTLRQVGMSAGIALAGMIFTIRQVFHTSEMAENNLEPEILSRLSVIGGFQDTLMVAVFLSFLGILTSAFIGLKSQSRA
jgi:EmrB/QacA subfamily drug resistance transporter